MLKLAAMKRHWLILGTVFLLTAVSWAKIEVFAPPDELTTFDNLVLLKAKTEPPRPVQVNNLPLAVAPTGNFSCGLVLRPGKNLVTIVAPADGQSVNRRILRLATFPDLERLFNGEKHWGRDQIVYLASLGYVEGYPDGNFYPANPITRGEFATWLARAEGLSLDEKIERDVFFDVPKEHWRAPYIKAAVAAGYFTGYSQEIFGIDDPLSRREAAEIVVKAEGLGVVDRIKQIFVDVSEGEKSAATIFTAQAKGLIVGTSTKIPIYDPDRPLTRAEGAVLLSRCGRPMADINDLFDFAKGYNSSKLCNLNIPPQFVSFTVNPKEAAVGQTVSLRLRAKLAPRLGFAPLSKVKVDLRQLGGLPDAEMFDAGDQIYSLNVSLIPSSGGEKSITATALDRLSWEGRASATLVITE